MRAALLVMGTLVGLALGGRGAHAQAAQRFSLNWVRQADAESCIASHGLATIVQNAFGPVFVTPDQAELAIEGQVSRESEGASAAWHARIAVSDRQGSVLGVRELRSSEPSCSTLNAQIVLVIAMAIDPEAALEGLPPELLEQLGAPADAADELLSELRAQQAASSTKAEPSPGSTSSASEHVSSTSALTPNASNEQRGSPGSDSKPDLELGSFPRLGVFAQLALSTGLLPNVEPALGIGLELHLARRFSVLGSGSWSVPSMLTLESPSIGRASVRFDLSMFSLAVCAAPLRARALRLSTCAGVSLLVRGTQSRGFTSAIDDTQLDPACLVGTKLVYADAAPWVFELGAALHVPLRRWRFTYRIPGATEGVDLFTSGALGLVAWLGAGVEL